MKTAPFGALLRYKKPRAVVVSVLTLAIALAARGGPPPIGAQQVNRVGLVVDFGDRHITRCVEFTESEISGHDVLRRAGLELVVDASNPLGTALCDINGTSGCPASNCFCRCQGSPCIYWAYHHLVNGSWQYSQVGASSYKVRNGDVEGWAWGEGALNNSGAQPPIVLFDQVCAPPATDTPVPTNTPIPPTNTPVPTNTAIPPTDTPVPPDTPEPEQDRTSVPAPEAWFRLDQNPIAVGSCTTLRWNTSHAREVYLDSEEVELNGSREICPATYQDYTLQVVGAEEEETYQLTLGVTGSGPVTTAQPLPAESPPAPSPASGSEEAALPPASAAETATVTSPSPTGTETLSSAPTPSLSPTPAQIARVQPTATTAEVARVQDPERQPSPSDIQSSKSPLLPIGYTVFSLIVGGLLGWLIYILRFRGDRA